jgi:hypothetical protein
MISLLAKLLAPSRGDAPAPSTGGAGNSRTGAPTRSGALLFYYPVEKVNIRRRFVAGYQPCEVTCF